jgi:hypothetical protein
MRGKALKNRNSLSVATIPSYNIVDKGGISRVVGAAEDNMLAVVVPEMPVSRLCTNGD